jgi:shikimate kinase
MNLKLKRTPGIYLAGFMGSGKSTVGRHLAHHLGWSFFDLDHEIERAEGCTIAEIFASRGEEEFRRIETEMLRQHVSWIERGRPSVVALGGGAFAQEANRMLLEDHGISIWLDCPFAIVERRACNDPRRPLAADPAKFRALFDSRRETYALADFRVEIESDDPELAVEAILRAPVLK